MNPVATDFHRTGISTDDVVIRGRSWVFTIDFEAFDPTQIDIWVKAMDHWSDITLRGGWKSSIFIALEDVIRLKAERPEAYPRFLEATRRMASAGATFYPHNHGVFDESTGLQAEHRPQRIPNYPKRASMFFDVVHRHGLDIREWMGRIASHFDDFLIGAGLPRPTQPAFRAGGWDHGVTANDLKAFVEGLAAAGFAWDSSASSGIYGTRSWRIGAPYGHNVFGLDPTVVEAACCWSVDGLGRLGQPRTVKALVGLARQSRLWRHHPGVFVTVLHFENLVRPNRATNMPEITRRIESLFSKLNIVRSALRIQSTNFDDISVGRS